MEVTDKTNGLMYSTAEYKHNPMTCSTRVTVPYGSPSSENTQSWLLSLILLQGAMCLHSFEFIPSLPSAMVSKSPLNYAGKGHEGISSYGKRDKSPGAWCIQVLSDWGVQRHFYGDTLSTLLWWCSPPCDDLLTHQYLVMRSCVMRERWRHWVHSLATVNSFSIRSV